MLTELVIRFVVGGMAVSAFAILGDSLKPKSFAGLFGAAPSIALATLVLTISKEGRAYAAIELRSMILGAVAFFVYAVLAARCLLSGKWSASAVTASALLIWCGCALGLWFALLR
jgi:Protein of unknown function (DUF3147)